MTARVLLLVVTLLVMPAVNAVRPASLLAGFPSGTVIVASSRHHCLRINAWFADRHEHHAQGLMFVEQLDGFEGMLFRYPRAAVITMWMKNTYVPLDMLFFRSDGDLARIEAETTPMSERRISSGEPVRSVLELPGGFAAAWGLDSGTRLLLAE